ncbi:MAG: FecR domain-containing protein [Bacteroidota bacterium]
MKITKELLRRYNEGETNSEENQAIESWFEQLDDESEEPKASIDPQLNKKQIWSKLSQDVPELNDETAQTKSKPALYQQIMRYAAAIIMLFAMGFSAYYFFNQSDSGAQRELAQFESIYTKRGEKRTVTLSDGSKIRMNYETVIKAPQRFEGDQRVVYLTGHAYFDIARDTERPFIIYTEDSKTQVLGTSFDINARQEDQTEIIVTSGQVAFSDKANEDNLVTLSVNDRATLSTDKSISTDEVNAIALTAWKDNQLVFEDKKLVEIIEVMEPWYNVKIDVRDREKLDKKYTLSFDNPSLELVIEQLSFLGDFQYEMETGQIVIY